MPGYAVVWPSIAALTSSESACNAVENVTVWAGDGADPVQEAGALPGRPRTAARRLQTRGGVQAPPAQHDRREKRLVSRGRCFLAQSQDITSHAGPAKDLFRARRRLLARR